MAKVLYNTNAAQRLLKSYGKDSLSYFALHDNKKLFFSSTGNSFLSYIIKGRIAIVSGNPVGLSGELPLLLKEFEYFIKGANLTSCYIAINRDVLQHILKLGHQKLHIGNEAIVELSRYNKNFLKKKVRRAERYIFKQGISCHIYKRKDMPARFLNQMKAVNKEWINSKGGKEKRFTMTLGRIPTKSDQDCEVVLALKKEKVIGYLIFVPVYASQGLSLDAMRRKDDAPNGLTEFLLLQAFEYFQQHGVNTISLNFATFHHHMHDLQKSISKLFIAILYKFLTRVYKTKNVYNFNNKFLPNWQERYIAFEKKRYLPNYLFAISRVEL